VLVVLSLALTLAVGWSWDQAVHGFVVSNCLIGASLGLCGALIAWYRPRNPVGWLFAVGGLCQCLTAAAAPGVQLAADQGAPLGVTRAIATVFAWAWPLNIGILVPVALLLFPDGLLPSRRWRWVLLATVVTGLPFLAEMGTLPKPVQPGLPLPYGVLRSHDDLAALWAASELRTSAANLLAIASLVVRYRRGDEQVRRQLLWLVLAMGLMTLVVAPWGLLAGTPIIVLFAIPLLPVAVTVAILRHRLLDIRVVVARALSYAAVSGAVLAVYALLVLALSQVVSALVAALLVLPLRMRVQRLVTRLFYGDRDNPLLVAERIGGSLDSDLAEVLDSLRLSLRLPALRLCAGDLEIVSGREPERQTELDLDELRLVVGLRPGETVLAPADQRVLALVAGPLGAAVRSFRLSQQLAASRERIVSVREEERRRLRRDLHDGLGPLLTGVAFGADAAENLVASNPGEAARLLETIRGDTRMAVREVRRILDDLRPVELDDLGLVEALRQRASQLARRPDGSRLDVSLDVSHLPPLPPPVEVAAFRIVSEALTNVVRHSRAQRARLRLAFDGDLLVEVLDDGGAAQAWGPGVGTTAIRERVAELGGTCELGPTASGGRLRARLPVEVS
jgi:signal transduction histidine kinase